MRIGTGFDIHRLAAGRPLVLCGARFDSDKGLLGHSDGDAPLHALCDALLGAAALGDIGRLFPADDPQWEGADSTALLRIVRDKVAGAGFRVANVDITVIAEKPKVSPRAAEMRRNVASALGMDEGSVSVKAKTMEGLGEIGRGEAIAAQAVALLESCN
ncbi:MAG: 2-C-methyl-D-erythritol 2,4-cyclodiphosphate synthase [Kiritimatiellae bacterium]|nr:2-C-methyl-D-erythritol 2,4-cyclodiphosphate synthase [Kiritimatiellia bacterium]